LFFDSIALLGVSSTPEMHRHDRGAGYGLLAWTGVSRFQGGDVARHFEGSIGLSQQQTAATASTIEVDVMDRS
jgi:hypothetical protein